MSYYIPTCETSSCGALILINSCLNSISQTSSPSKFWGCWASASLREWIKKNGCSLKLWLARLVLQNNGITLNVMLLVNQIDGTFKIFLSISRELSKKKKILVYCKQLGRYWVTMATTSYRDTGLYSEISTRGVLSERGVLSSGSGFRNTRPPLGTLCIIEGNPPEEIRLAVLSPC